MRFEGMLYENLVDAPHPDEDAVGGVSDDGYGEVSGDGQGGSTGSVSSLDPYEDDNPAENLLEDYEYEAMLPEFENWLASLSVEERAVLDHLHHLFNTDEYVLNELDNIQENSWTDPYTGKTEYSTVLLTTRDDLISAMRASIGEGHYDSFFQMVRDLPVGPAGDDSPIPFDGIDTDTFDFPDVDDLGSGIGYDGGWDNDAGAFEDNYWDALFESYADDAARDYCETTDWSWWFYI